jgi:hypothetical protein
MIKNVAQAWSEHVNYSDAHECIFIHIPKNAGTSIARFLGLKVTSHLTLAELAETTFFKHNQNTPIFAIVRHPLTRFLSLYNYARMDISYYHNNIEPEKGLYGAHADYIRLRHSSIDEAIDLLVEGKLTHSRRWNHWQPQVRWIQCSDESLNQKVRLIRQEHLAIDMGKLFGKEMPELPHLNTSPSPIMMPNIGPDQLAKLAGFYCEDLSRLSYTLSC